METLFSTYYDQGAVRLLGLDSNRKNTINLINVSYFWMLQKYLNIHWSRKTNNLRDPHFAVHKKKPKKQNNNNKHKTYSLRDVNRGERIPKQE